MDELSISSSRNIVSENVKNIEVDTCDNLSVDNLVCDKNDSNIGLTQANISVKGRLKQHLNFWEKIEANEFILDVVANGYKLPFKCLPESVHLKNNRSSLNNDEFVRQSINELIITGAAVEVKHKPKVVNPLTVAENATKKRLVLDLRHVNECLDM